MTCTSLDALENGSFENGFTDWGFASGTSASVVSGSGADGSYLQASGSQVAGLLIYQRLTNLVAGNTYAVSFDYQVKPNIANIQMTCQLSMYMDSFTAA